MLKSSDEAVKTARAIGPRKFLLGMATACLSAVAYCSDGGWLSPIRDLFQGREHVTGSVASKIIEFEDKWDMWSLAFSPDGTRLAMDTPPYDEVHVWAWQGRPHLIQTLHQERGGMSHGLRYSPDGRLLASAHHQAGGPGEHTRIVRVWNSADGTIVGDIAERLARGSSLDYGGLAFSPDGRYLIRNQWGGSRTTDSTETVLPSLFVHDTTTFQAVWLLRTEPFEPKTLAVSPDGRLVALIGRRLIPTVNVYDMPTSILRSELMLVDLAKREGVRTFDILDDECDMTFVAWNPTGSHLAVGGACYTQRPDMPPAPRHIDQAAAVQLFDVSGNKLAEQLNSKSGGVRGLEYSGDGRFLMIGWDRVVEIWDAEHTKLLQETQFPEQVTAATFSQDSHHMAIATLDRRISVWEMK